MNDSELEATCSDCGAPRSKEPGPCPDCGSRDRSLPLGPPVEFEFTVESLTVRKVSEFVRRHPWWTAAGGAAFLLDLGIALFAPALGPLVGTAATITFGVISFVAGEKSTILVREIEKRPARG